MAARFAGKYDILDREVKLGMHTLSAVESSTGHRVSIFCLPLSVLQIELPCPPEFIENRFRSALTFEGNVLEADVDPETECAYVVVGAARSEAEEAADAPTREFRAWLGPSGGANDEPDATAERPAWRESPPMQQQAERSTPQPPAEPQPASAGGVSFTQFFAGPSAENPASADFGRQPPSPVKSREAPEQQNESFTAVFKAASPAFGTPPTPETQLAPSSSPVPQDAETPSGGFTAMFGVKQSSSPSPSPSAFAAPAESPIIESAQRPAGAFTAMFGGAQQSRAAQPEAKLAPDVPPGKAPGAFTAMFDNPPASPAADSSLADPPRKAPGGFTELFQNTPEPSPAHSSAPIADLNADLPPISPPSAPSAKPGGFTDIFGSRSNDALRPAAAAPPAAPSAPQVDLNPRFDRPSSATQYGAQQSATPPVQSEAAAPAPRSGPSQYTVVRKGWSAPPPPSDPPAPNSLASNLPQAPGAIPPPQWSPMAAPAPPSAPQIPGAPQVPMAQPAMPQYQTPAWPPQAVPPQPPAMPAVPAAPQAPALAAQPPAKSKPSYLPLIIIFNALFVLAVIIVLIFVFTKH